MANAPARNALKTIFAVFGTTTPPAVKTALDRVYPLDHIEVGPGQWLVIAEGTAKDVSDTLGITGGTLGSAVVVSASGYFGRAPSNIWEWLAAKMKAGLSG